MGFVKTKWSHFAHTVDKHLLVYKVTYSSKKQPRIPEKCTKQLQIALQKLVLWSVFSCVFWSVFLYV